MLHWVAALLCVITAVSAQFTTRPSDQTVDEGNSVSVTCTHPAATSIAWKKDDRPIFSSALFNISSSMNSRSSTLTIGTAEHNAHAGNYECVAVLGSNRNEVTNFTITVHYLNTSIAALLSYDECYTQAMVNTTITLQCYPPDGVPEVRVSWYKNNVKIRQADHSNIVFTQSKRIMRIMNLSLNDSGIYQCRANNDLGILRFSGNVSVNVRVLRSATEVSIEDGSSVFYAREGRPAVMTCRITPPPSPLTVRWKHNSEFITSGFSGYVLFDNICEFELRINAVTASHAGTYRCSLAGDSPPSAERVLSIARINDAYAVTASPSAHIGVGREVQLLCAPSGNPGNVPANFYWKFTNASGNDLGRVRNSARVLVTGGSLNITQMSLRDTGMYTCVASNPQTTSIFTSINIAVEAPPAVSVVPVIATVQINSSVSLRCTTSSHMASFTWTFGDDPAPVNSERYNITSQGGTSIFNISDLMSADLGNYSCNVMDAIHLPVSAEVSVVETSDLYFVGGTINRTEAVPNGSALVLPCPVRGGNGSVSVQWFRWLTDEARVAVSHDKLLILNPATLADEATYVCMATDDETSIELEFEVTVTIPGNIVKWPLDPNGTVGNRIQLDCEVTGKPLPSVTWLYEGQTVSSLNDNRITDRENGTLIINPLAEEHDGNYYCYVQKPTLVLKTIRLRVQPAPPIETPDQGFHIGSLNRNESILVLTVCCGAFLLLLLSFLVIVCLCCFCCTARKHRSSYDIGTKEPPTGEFKRQPSLRKDNSGILTQSPSANLFGDLNSTHNPPFNPPAIPLTTYGGIGGSVISDSIRQSHTPSPIPHTTGTLATSSLYSLEDQVSITTNLPNFPRANLKLGDVMGEGEFGPVLMGWAKNILPKQERTQVAVKVLLARGEEEGFQPELALVDFANQMKLEYTNIATILGMCTDSEPYYIIYEYLDQGDLKKYLMSCCPEEEGDHPVLTQQNLHRIILQVADGMAYLFSQRIIHGDIATRNCLVSSDLKVKIADLGIGHDLYSGDYYDNGAQLLPIRWMPPELLEDSKEGPSFSLHSDIWSFGVFCWEVFAFARLPFDDLSDHEVLEMVSRGTTLSTPSEECPPRLYAIMQECWDPNPEDRPRFAKLCVAIIDLELD